MSFAILRYINGWLTRILDEDLSRYHNEKCQTLLPFHLLGFMNQLGNFLRLASHLLWQKVIHQQNKFVRNLPAEAIKQKMLKREVIVLALIRLALAAIFTRLLKREYRTDYYDKNQKNCYARCYLLRQ